VSRLGSHVNPLASDDPRVWDELLEAIGPASLLVVIESRLGNTLRRRHTAEDVYQEAVLRAWRDREKVEWRGVRAFRSWMLTVIDNRIRDLAEREGAQKRGGADGELRAADLRGVAGAAPAPLGGMVTTSPSRVAIYREQAEAMRDAVGSLPHDVREVVRLRLFEQLRVEDIAGRLGIGPSAVRHRFRRGAELYHERLIASLAGSTTRGRIGPPAARPPADPAPG
jgi:RNA polymerase sigma factor (sigma-70 family)